MKFWAKFPEVVSGTERIMIYWFLNFQVLHFPLHYAACYDFTILGNDFLNLIFLYPVYFTVYSFLFEDVPMVSIAI